MATNPPDLKLYMKVQDGQIVDASEQKANLSLSTAYVQGSVINFGDSAVNIVSGWASFGNLSAGFSMEVWMMCPGLQSGTTTFLNMTWLQFSFIDGKLDLQTNYIDYTGVYPKAESNQLSTDDVVAIKNQWVHVAATLDTAGTAALYVNGTCMKRDSYSAMLGMINSLAAGGSQIQIATLRIYARALTAAEIQADMLADVGPTGLNKQLLADVEASYPVDFALTNQQGQAVLYTRLTTQAVDLELINSSRANMTIKPATAAAGTPPTDTDSSIYLTFRPGTLWTTDITLGDDTAKTWQLVRDDKRTDQCVGYYLSVKPDSKLDPIAPLGSTTIQLQGIQVDGRGGSRSTRVKLKYKNLVFAGSAHPLSGHRQHYLAIMDELPSQAPSRPPVRIDWVGSNTILNDGQTLNTLTLRLLNQSDHDLTLSDASKISIDYSVAGTSNPWGLLLSGDGGLSVKTVAPSTAGSWSPPTNPSQQSAEAVTWEISSGFTGSQTGTLKNAEYIDIQITFKTSAPNGTAWLTVSYDGFGNLSDTVQAPVLKTPLVIPPPSNGASDLQRNVGIGTNTPQNVLDVHGALAIGSGYAGTNAAPQDGLIVQGNVGIGTASPKGTLHVFIPPLQTDPVPDAPTATWAALIENKYNGINQNGLLVTNRWGDSQSIAFQVATYSDGKENQFTPALTVTGGRNVGIGTTSPQNALDVHGALAIGSGYAGTNAAPQDGLLVQGNVGIGTVSPKNTLDVHGALAIGSAYAGTKAAPSDGLIVQGNVGIGTDDPKSTLHVVGRLTLDDYGALAIMANATYYNGTDKVISDGFAGRIKFLSSDGVWWFETSTKKTHNDTPDYECVFAIIPPNANAKSIQAPVTGTIKCGRLQIGSATLDEGTLLAILRHGW